MREPRRLLQQEATPAERALLHSAHADGPPNGAAARMLLALEGLTAASGAPNVGQEPSAAASTASAAAPAMKLGALAKIGLATLIGVGAVGGGALVHHLSRHQPPAENAGVPSLQEAQATGPASAEGTSPATVAPSEGPARAEPTPVLAPALPSTPDESLSAELRLLDRARAEVEAGNPTAAQRALDRYAQRFAQGRLKPEAAVLHLAVLVQRGDRAAARVMAKQLLAKATYKTYEPRIRALLREAEP